MIVRLNPLKRKLHTSHSTGREFCGGHVEKANFATLGVVLSFIFEGFKAELWRGSEGMEKYQFILVNQMPEFNGLASVPS